MLSPKARFASPGEFAQQLYHINDLERPIRGSVLICLFLTLRRQHETFLLCRIANDYGGCSDQKRHPDFTSSTKTTLTDAYYVRTYQHGAYIIEHKGHRLAAQCRESRTWLDGNNKSYKLMYDKDCIYMAEVGQYIGDDLILRFGTSCIDQPRRESKFVG